MARRGYIEKHNAPTDVYRYYDARGQLLYVGISLSTFGRAAEHRAASGWWQDATRMQIQHFSNRTAALAAERLAIRMERPLHNVHGRAA